MPVKYPLSRNGDGETFWTLGLPDGSEMTVIAALEHLEIGDVRISWEFLDDCRRVVQERQNSRPNQSRTPAELGGDGATGDPVSPSEQESRIPSNSGDSHLVES